MPVISQMATEQKSQNTVEETMKRLQPKYCCYCGNENDKCQCDNKTITISINLNNELLKGLGNLTSLIPKIQISTDRCQTCGHSNAMCTCK